MYSYSYPSRQIQLIAILWLVLAAGCSKPPQSPLNEVTESGSNPGELRMFEYVPEALKPPRSARTITTDPPKQGSVSKTEQSEIAGAPLVVALHGCTQDAAEYAEDSGWIRLADRWGFFLLLPQQERSNSLLRCFNWFSSEDHRRDNGEALSIRQMIHRMRQDHAIDPRRIYITGVSAGAAMTVAMLAAYPEVFAGGAPVAGIPFGCADGLVSGLSCMRTPPEKDAAQWGQAVRSASSYTGPWPRISVWQGEADSAVDPANAKAIVRQWTNVHGIADSLPTQVSDLEGIVHNLYRDSGGRTLVEAYWIKDMNHGLPVDPGSGAEQCGKASRFFPDVDICSSIRIARFWRLDRGKAEGKDP